MAISIQIKLFAAYQEAAGQPELHLELPDGTTAGDVLTQILAQHPQLERWRHVTRYGVNLQFVTADQVLQNGDELVLIPPVSGG
jgi:sulfur-carrier protein